jgi:integrase
MDVRRIGKTDCLTWSAKFSREQEPSPTAYNNTVLVLRKVLDVAMEFGALYDNPARFISRARPRQRNPELPNRELFEKWVSTMDTLGDGWCKASADFVRFLAFSGLRKGEAARVAWRDVDLGRGTIVVRGDEETGTKNGETRQIPIVPEMGVLLNRLRSESGGQPEAKVARVSECQGNMDRAASRIGMKRITHHDLRHLFATRCIESGVDIPTVSRWLGHKDGGALAMKVYGHLQDAHSTEMAKRVTCGTSALNSASKQDVA